MTAELLGPRIVLPPATEEDLPTLLTILRESEVARFWPAPEDAADLLTGDDPDGAERITTS